MTAPTFEKIKAVYDLIKKLPQCCCYRCKKDPPKSSSDLDGSPSHAPIPALEGPPETDSQDPPPNQNKNI